MVTYSFMNVGVAFAGPGGILSLGQGASVAKEGITVEPAEDKNVMTIGADGQGQHSLVAGDAALVTIRLLKVSPLNAQLMIMYNLQKSSSALWGINVATISDSGRGDVTLARQMAFKKKPVITYDQEGPMMEWAFDAIYADTVLGT